MTKTNTTSTYEIRFEDGEVATDKAKDTFGGYCNMMRRLEAKAAGRKFTVEAVNVL